MILIMNNKNLNIYEIENEYKYPDITIFTEYSNNYLKILKILNDDNLIQMHKRRIFLLYLECGSLRKTQLECGINYRKIGNVVNEVKMIIKNNLEICG